LSRVTDLVKTLRTPLALLALVLLAAFVGSSCSSVDPVALQVGQWQLSNKDFEDQIQPYADAYLALGGDETQLHPTTDGTWPTALTAFLLNEQLTSQLAVIAAQDRELEITDDDRADARSQLEQQFSGSDGTSVFGDLAGSFQDVLVEGTAARTLLASGLGDDDITDDLLRDVYDANQEQFGGRSFDEVKDGLVEVLRANPDLLFQAVLAETAQGVEIYVDGRYGQLDPLTGQIATPSGADPAPTTSTSLDDTGDSAPAAG